MPELKNCPFCGETPQLKHAVGEYWPLCKCEVSGRSTSTEAGAIAAWNRRVPPPPDRGMVEKLKNARKAAHYNRADSTFEFTLEQMGDLDIAIHALECTHTASQPQPERLFMVGAETYVVPLHKALHIVERKRIADAMTGRTARTTFAEEMAGELRACAVTWSSPSVQTLQGEE